jgi:hypothetical protein
MRYRIQIEPLLGSTVCVITEIYGTGGRHSTSSRLYTIQEEIGQHGGLVEILGQLQALVAESAP